MDDRHIRQEGGTYFFTVNLAERPGSLLVDRVDDPVGVGLRLLGVRCVHPNLWTH